MPVYPGAIWEPIGVSPGAGSNGNMHSYTGLVLHVNDADSLDLHDFFSNNMSTGGDSAHWQLTKDGILYQYIDTQFSSWCQQDGNDDYLSIETQGFPNQPLTAAQVAKLAGLYTWVHDTHAIPYALAEVPGQAGFAWHGMGGADWGGHTGCPGDPRKAQRTQILTLAQGGSAPTPSKPSTPVGEAMYEVIRNTKSGAVRACGPKFWQPLEGKTKAETLANIKNAITGPGCVKPVVRDVSDAGMTWWKNFYMGKV